MNKLSSFLKRHLFAPAEPSPPPIWAANDPQGSSWGEILSVSPTIVHVWPSIGFPLGGASAIGAILKNHPVHFLIMPAWTLELGDSETLALAAAAYLRDHPRHRLTFLCNTAREEELMRGHGYAALIINQNCLMNDAVFKPVAGVGPIYDAVYNARLAKDKRPELAREIEKLAMIYFYDHFGGSPAAFHAEHARLQAMMPTARFVNALTPEGCEWLPAPRINAVLAQSRVGLCLSPIEGAMRAAIEYLFAGLSVVSTPSVGGRDYFFDDEFCLIAKPDPRSIREAVDALVARNVPRDYVRARTLARITAERERYIGFVQDLIDRGGGTNRFEDRFRQCTAGETVMRWRSMKEFGETISRLLSGEQKLS